MFIQILLIFLGFFIWIVTFYNFKYHRINSQFAILSSSFSIVLILFSIFPGVAVFLANLWGVDRATDLFVYVMIPFLFYLFILLYAKHKELEHKFVEFVRTDAISSFKKEYFNEIKKIKFKQSSGKKTQ